MAGNKTRTTGNKTRTRWGAAELSQILALLKDKVQIRADQSPFGRTEEGLIDLRGFSVPTGEKISGCRLIDCDLSDAVLSSAWIESSVFENVCFDRADLSDISDRGNSFSNCSFVASKFQGAGIGYLGSVFTDCGFEKANFTKSVFIRAEMNECRFIDCKLKGADFNASSFADCYFEGKLEDVWFRGGFPLPSDTEEFGKPRKNLMQNVSFQKASMWGVNFSDQCDLSTVIPPSSGNYRLYSSWKNRLERLTDIAESWPPSEKAEAKIFIYSYMVHAKNQDWFLLNCDEIEKEFGKALGGRIIDGLDSFN